MTCVCRICKKLWSFELSHPFDSNDDSSNLSKKFRLTTHVSQLVDRSCLGAGKTKKCFLNCLLDPFRSRQAFKLEMSLSEEDLNFQEFVTFSQFSRGPFFENVLWARHEACYFGDFFQTHKHLTYPDSKLNQHKIISKWSWLNLRSGSVTLTPSFFVLLH